MCEYKHDQNNLPITLLIWMVESDILTLRLANSPQFQPASQNAHYSLHLVKNLANIIRYENNTLRI